ncbi:MAG TPA: DUF92 domain-containing protein [Candidatus Lustribacter sp.]|nr:DUF92 domain-containing protein [Candidatus Lustribacter sp.]
MNTAEEAMLGGVVALLIAIAAVRVHALTRGGGIAAFVVGTITFACGTLGTALILLAFFVSSIALTRQGKKRKRELVDIGKGGPRDGWQVLANGGIATVCILAWVVVDHSRILSIWFVAFCGAYAAATADTWGTEVGTLVEKPPRSILTGKPLATGLSGGVSTAGTAAEVAGAVLIAILAPAALLLAVPGGTPVSLHALSALILPVFVGGFGGAMIDSLLGATLQDRRWCPACERECEVELHGCGTATVRRRGLSWISNDDVNLAATLSGALIAAATYIIANHVILSGAP